MPTETFDDLQRRLIDRLQSGAPEEDAAAIVVCPSITFPAAELRKIVGIQFYEERLLFLTLLLRDPNLEMLYPTSVRIDPAIVDYYLNFLPDPEDARRRLHVFSVDDDEPSALTDKLLARPDVVARMRGLLNDPQRSFILPFNVTKVEAQLAEALGVPVYGTHPDLVWVGSKSGAREVALAAGVEVFQGAGDLYSLEAIATAIDEIKELRSHRKAVVAKLNNGFSGQGNVILELDQIRTPLRASPAVFCASEESWATFGPKVEEEGAIVEELARDPGTVSPSVQLRILPGGRCEIISTHDQILGGPDEQVYLGCRFPARDDYRLDIQANALRVAKVLAQRGVIGSFGIDFVVVPDVGIYLSEINLRLGGTTHPYLMTKYVTGGEYDTGTGTLLVRGEPRVYLSSDNIKSEHYIGLQPAQLIAAMADAGLAYNAAAATGVTLHLLGALPRFGKCGVVCIARTHTEADDLYQRTLACIDVLASVNEERD